jgi:peptide/nickel transport system permease protein
MSTTVTTTERPATGQSLATVARGKPRGLWRDAYRRLIRNRGAVVGGIVFLLIIVMAVAAPLLAPHDPIALAPRQSLQAPSETFWFGTDQFGRDVLSRIIYGARVSVVMGLVAVTIAVTGGSLVGLLAGYYQGVPDMIVGRAVDVMFAFPGILLALVVIAILGPDLGSAMIAVGISAMPLYVRVVRGSVLSLRNIEYVEAARVMGGSDLRIVLRHILPNTLAPIIVLASLGIASAIIAGAALSFLGLGIRPPTPDWGEMLSNSRAYLSSAWWLSTFPGLAIVIMVMSINLLGDGLRDALDPRLQGRV